MDLSVYREVSRWKKPLHVSRTALATSYLKLLPNLKIVGIAGSVGKTLTQNTVASTLSQKYSTITGDENLDPTFRIPQTILKAKPWTNYLVLEYGVEHPLDMNHYLKIATPHMAVLTTISTEHTKYLKDLDGVIKEEAKIIKYLPKTSYALLSADEPISKKISTHTNATVVWFGEHAKKGVKISHFKQNLHGSKFRIHYGGQVASVNWKIVGKHQLTSAYIAATVGILSNLTIKQIAKGLSQVKPPAQRLNLKITQHANILDDTYNSSPKAAIESINTLKDLGKGKNKIAVLGEMKDLGVLSEESHIEIGVKVAKSRLNVLVTIGTVAHTIAKTAKKEGFRGKIIKVKNTKEAIKALRPYVSKKSLILVKGSRHAHLERIVLGLLHKSTQINCYHCGRLK